MSTSGRPPAIGWNWSLALLGAVYALPALVVIPFDTTKGLALAIGVLPAAAASGLPGPRRARVSTIVLGVLIGTSMVIGAVLAQLPWIAVPAVFALSVGAAYFAPRGRLGRLGLGLCLPMVGIGLSFGSLGEALGLGLLMTTGCVYACLASLLWPVGSPAPAPRPAPTPDRAAARPATRSIEYGIRLGAAAAIAAAIGFLLHLEHVGWACAAVLLVMRPAPEMVRSRGFDRTLCVLIGASLACLFALAAPPPAAIAATVALAIIGLAGSKPSRRYVTPLFTTFLVILMMVLGNPGDAEHRFLERFGETVLGVALAVVFGVLIPRLRGPIAEPGVPAEAGRRLTGQPPGHASCQGMPATRAGPSRTCQSSNSSSRNDRALRFLLLP